MTWKTITQEFIGITQSSILEVKQDNLYNHLYLWNFAYPISHYSNKKSFSVVKKAMMSFSKSVHFTNPSILFLNSHSSGVCLEHRLIFKEIINTWEFETSFLSQLRVNRKNWTGWSTS